MYVVIVNTYIVEVRNDEGIKHIAISSGMADEQDFNEIGMLTNEAKDKFGLDSYRDVAEAIGLETFEVDPETNIAVDTNGLKWKYVSELSHWVELSQ